MNENLKTKITRRLDDLSDDIGRQVLDYLEFLESKYNMSRRAPSTMQRIAEGLEDRIGNVSVSDVATKGAAQVMDAASKMMEGLAAAGRVVAEELSPSAPAEVSESEAGADGAALEDTTDEADQPEEAHDRDA